MRHIAPSAANLTANNSFCREQNHSYAHNPKCNFVTIICVQGIHHDNL